MSKFAGPGLAVGRQTHPVGFSNFPEPIGIKLSFAIVLSNCVSGSIEDGKAEGRVVVAGAVGDAVEIAWMAMERPRPSLRTSIRFAAVNDLSGRPHPGKARARQLHQGERTLQLKRHIGLYREKIRWDKSSPGHPQESFRKCPLRGLRCIEDAVVLRRRIQSPVWPAIEVNRVVCSREKAMKQFAGGYDELHWLSLMEIRRRFRWRLNLHSSHEP